MTRTERQCAAIEKWKQSGCRGCIVAATGFGPVYAVTMQQSRLLEESNKLLSGNIGKSPNKDDTEINLEIKKSKSSYSVESEPSNRI